MDGYCEFCVSSRSIVYCKSDAAYLCLSCDTKVHSANPLSKRHHRALVCESCRRRPTHVHCHDHRKFMCRGCDLREHDSSSQHRKRVVKGYSGSPSARDLGLLWGFDLNQEDHGDMQGFSVLLQLIHLFRVQLQTSNVDHVSSVIRCQEHKRENEARFSQDLLPREGSLAPCSSPFTPLTHLESPEAGETDIHGESFWQCKSPVSSNQLWYQNMQDLGVCEEPSSLDHLNIPDIDLTFRNIEELFRAEQESAIINQDTSMAAPSAIIESSPKKARYSSQTTTFFHPRLITESGDTVCISSSFSYESMTLKGKKNENLQLKDSIGDQWDYRKERSDTRK